MKGSEILARLGVFALVVLQAAGGAGQGKIKTTLPAAYQTWLNNDVAYIITSKEREVFLQLQTDRERDLFIEAFWKQRDQTPGTPENEFMQEHYRRIAYANEYYGRETTRPGWQTDRGRIYILLGPPADIVSIQGEGFVYPAQIWVYEGKGQYGLPPQFQLVFFKRDGVGEYVLYSPMQDGPGRLMVNYQGDPVDREGTFLRLQRYDSRLAQASLSLIPGESAFLGQPTLGSEQLLSQIATVPEKMVDEKYAEAMLKFKERVEVEYSANYVPSEAVIGVFQDASGIFFVHYSLEPKRLSLLTQGDTYRLSFALDGIVTDAQGRVVFQYEKNIPLDFHRDQVDDIRKTSLEIQDMIPLIDGDYTFSLLMKNTVSKEFTAVEGRVSIPADLTPPQMGPLLLGYQRKSVASTAEFNKPFKIGREQISCQAGNIFHAKEKLVVFFQIYGLTGDLARQGTVKYAVLKDDREFSASIKMLKDADRINVVEEIPLNNLPPASYQLKVSILDREKKELTSATQEFGVSPMANLPRPWIVSRVMPASDDPEYAYILGSQSANSGRTDEAERYLQTAFRRKPSSLKYGLGLAQVFSKKGDFRQAKEVLFPFLEKAGSNDQFLSTLGAACQALGEYQEAAALYQKYLSHAGTSVPILNSLGECHYHLGNFKEALFAWEKSLEINPRQESIRKRVEEIKQREKASL
jgi:GWxTD domain-containing protein